MELCNNTESTLGTQAVGNSKTTACKPFRSRKIVLTLNNYTIEEYNNLSKLFKKKDWKYIIGKEVGEEKKTPHLQMYIESKNAIYNTTLLKCCKRLHIEKARGSREENFKYCSKEGKYESNMITKKPIKDKIPKLNLHDWQKQILSLFDEEPDDRLIYWYVDNIGCKGKTSLARHICLNYKALYVSGKCSDVLFGVCTFLEEQDIDMVIFDFTRSVEGFISYQAIETLKNGIMFNTKYKSGMCIFNIPHVVCLSNFEPDITKMSSDRWKVLYI